jgi:light-regulated signal transduction histidine kinase (bacteriophytochrome)
MKKPSIFLSHNKIDKQFARRLATDLKLAGAEVWFDEAEIKLGDSLISKIENGIDVTDYLGIVLSPDSVNSSWVRKEVEIALNKEILGKKVIVLPFLYRECKIPGFLLGKKYADFRSEENYISALNEIKAKLDLELTDDSWNSDQISERERFAIEYLLHDMINNNFYINSAVQSIIKRGIQDNIIYKKLQQIQEVTRISRFQFSEYRLNRDFQFGKYPLRKEYVPDIAYYINRIISSISIVYDRDIKTRFISYDDRKIGLMFDKNLIELALRNLLYNAYKYSYKNSVVKVTLNQNSTFVEILISSRGIKIESEDLPKIFLRGWRSDAAKQISQGLGTGLYLSNLIASTHGGEIHYIPGNELNENIFVMSLPLRY